MTDTATLRSLLPPPPARIARLPRDPRGYPIPFFVCKDPLDFRVIAPGALAACANGSRCWVCGDRLGRTFCFVAGPMCGINRTSAEPPSHTECAEWSARACPFLTRPRMRRNEKGLPDDAVPAAGFGLSRNPGVALLYVTRSYKPFRPHQGSDGVLFEMGLPLDMRWFAEGRPASRAEVQASIDSGLTSLDAACDQEANPAQRQAARRELARRAEWLQGFLPEAA